MSGTPGRTVYPETIIGDEDCGIFISHHLEDGENVMIEELDDEGETTSVIIKIEDVPEVIKTLQGILDLKEVEEKFNQK